MEIAHVGFVHAYYKVEIVEIALAYLPADMGQVQSALTGVGAHARIRQITNVISPGSGRVYLPSDSPHDVRPQPHASIRRRRTSAYIAEAYEKDADPTGICYLREGAAYGRLVGIVECQYVHFRD